MPNINIEMPEELHKRLKLQALLSDQTFKDFFIQVLEESVASGGTQTNSERKRTGRGATRG